MIEHSVNSSNNFIMGWYSDNTYYCDELIQYHKTGNKRPGMVAQGIDTSIKDSTDVNFNNDVLSRIGYGKVLSRCVDLYLNRYEQAQGQYGFGIIEPCNIIHYKPNGGFKIWHKERQSSELPSAVRHLVWMTYLNDVTDGGETEFLYQNVKIKAEKGLTLIWPSDWTHTHRGIVSPTQEKYIVTGYFSFPLTKE